MMMPDRAPQKVTIEDLLRLKRAERPTPEFWTRFEEDLRAKQLAAIVAKRPWWHALHLPRAARLIARFQVPAGAAAALALSFVVANHYYDRPAPVTPEAGSPAVSPPRPSQLRAAPVAIVPAEVAALPGPLPKAVAEAPAPGRVEPAAPARVEVADVEPSPSSSPVELTSMIPWGVGQEADATPAESPVSTRLLQAGLQIASVPAGPVTSLLGDAPAAEPPAVAEVRPAVAQAPSSRELRRAKVLAGLVLADNAEGADYSRAVHGRELAVNDLSEDQLYDSARRLGVGGDRLTLKF